MFSELKKPLVAIYVSNKVFANLLQQNDEKYYKLKLLIEANKIAQTTLYLFTAASINFTNSIIKGIYYHEKKCTWELGYFPFPDVFHDRVNMTTPVRQKNLAKIRTKFAQQGIAKINSRHFFDKWELYSFLSKNPQLSPHLPFTMQLQSEAELEKMFSHCDKVYIKGRTGNRGMEVMSVRKLDSGNYEYKHHRKVPVKQQVEGTSNLLKVIDYFFRKKDLLIQEAIDLVTTENRLVDLRGEVQRNGRGELEVIAIPARVGQTDSPVTTRGYCLSFDNYCFDILGLSKDRVRAFAYQLQHFLFSVYQNVEDYYGPFGELGIDLGLDKAGKIWLIECNAKPSKVSLIKTADQQTIIRAYYNPLEYARYLYDNNKNNSL